MKYLFQTKKFLYQKKKNLIFEAEKMFGKTLVTHQTGPDGKEVKRLYIEEASNISKEFYQIWLKNFVRTLSLKF